MDFDFDNLQTGEALPDLPMTSQQRWYIEHLLQTCSYTDDTKQGIENALDCKITIEEAGSIIDELEAAQIDDISLARSGKLKEKPLAAALRRIINMDNT